jgi:hypothetical protein
MNQFTKKIETLTDMHDCVNAWEDEVVFNGRKLHKLNWLEAMTMAEVIRKLHPETVPVESKAAGNYLNGMVALQDAKRRAVGTRRRSEWAGLRPAAPRSPAQ